MKHRISLATAILAIGLLLSPAAWAEGDDGDEQSESAGDDAKPDAKPAKKTKRKSRRHARKKFAEGAKLTAELRYTEAAAAFSEAYEHDPKPETLYNLATVYRLEGSPENRRKAYEYYEKFLAGGGRGSLARSAKRYMKGLKERLDEEDARLAREKQLRDEAEATRREVEKAKADAAEARRAGEQSLAEAQAALAKSQAERDAMQAERDAMRRAMREGRGNQKRLIGTAVVAVGGLALGMGLKAGLDASSANSELDALGPEDAWGEGYAWLHEHGQSSQNRMLLFTISGALLIGGGATLYYLGHRESRTAASERAVSVVPSVGGDSAGVQVLGRF